MKEMLTKEQMKKISGGYTNPNSWYSSTLHCVMYDSPYSEFTQTFPNHGWGPCDEYFIDPSYYCDTNYPGYIRWFCTTP
jgi:hypothetical protein